MIRSTDARLVRRASNGDSAAFAAIFAQHRVALHRYCRSIVHNEDDATDALQSTMLRMIEALPGEERRIALRPWLFRIAHNESVNLLRARQPTALHFEALTNVGDPSAGTVPETRHRLQTLATDLQALTERQRGALLLRELVGLSFDEIATSLDTTETAAKQSVYEARKALVAREAGRARPCDDICRTLSNGDGRRRRSAAVQAHLADCSGCRAFGTGIAERPAQLQSLTPPSPDPASAPTRRFRPAVTLPRATTIRPQPN